MLFITKTLCLHETFSRSFSLSLYINYVTKPTKYLTDEILLITILTWMNLCSQFFRQLKQFFRLWSNIAYFRRHFSCVCHFSPCIIIAIWVTTATTTTTAALVFVTRFDATTIAIHNLNSITLSSRLGIQMLHTFGSSPLSPHISFISSIKLNYSLRLR